MKIDASAERAMPATRSPRSAPVPYPATGAGTNAMPAYSAPKDASAQSRPTVSPIVAI